MIFSMKELLKDLYQIWKLLIVILTPIVLLPIPLAAGGKVKTDSVIKKTSFQHCFDVFVLLLFFSFYAY